MVRRAYFSLTASSKQSRHYPWLLQHEELYGSLPLLCQVNKADITFAFCNMRVISEPTFPLLRQSKQSRHQPWLCHTRSYIGAYFSLTLSSKQSRHYPQLLQYDELYWSLLFSSSFIIYQSSIIYSIILFSLLRQVYKADITLGFCKTTSYAIKNLLHSFMSVFYNMLNQVNRVCLGLAIIKSWGNYMSRTSFARRHFMIQLCLGLLIKIIKKKNGK